MKFTKSHEWVVINGNTATIGLSDFAQKEMGDIVFASLPAVGEKLTLGKPFADVESVKAVSEVISPVTGKVLEINKDLDVSPELINENPYGAWLIKAEFNAIEQELLDEAEYLEFVK